MTLLKEITRELMIYLTGLRAHLSYRREQFPADEHENHFGEGANGHGNAYLGLARGNFLLQKQLVERLVIATTAGMETKKA